MAGLLSKTQGQAEVALVLSLQVATGERLRTVWEWREWIALWRFAAPQGPGLGVEIDEAAVARFAV